MKTEVLVETAGVKCPECGIIFWVGEEYKQHRQDDHRTMYCPNGHSLYFPAETEAERLQRLVLSKTRDLRDMTKDRDYYRDKATQLTKRINAGVCPHCHRHFMNVERHIKNKHPGKG